MVAVFALGILAGLLLAPQPLSREETPQGTAGEQLVPADRIMPDNIHVYADHVRIDLPHARWANFSATGSMSPVLGHTAHALQIIPKKENDIRVGDIVSYHTDKKIIIHRVIETGTDERGWYAVTKGDNNAIPDPEPVRFAQIDRVLVAVIY